MILVVGVVGWVIILMALVVISAALRGTNVKARTRQVGRQIGTKAGTSTLRQGETEHPYRAR
jgi:hypothetical protein